jgi:plastocyanin
MIMRLRRSIFCAVGGGALLLAAWPAAAAPRTYTVVIDKLKFGPLPVGLHKGDTIVWVNKDFLRHTATAADHSFDVDLQAGASGKTVLTKTGSIAFVCRFHPNMRGVLEVK